MLRQAYLFPKSIDRIADTFFWPILDILILGFTTQWVASHGTESASLIVCVLFGAVYWRVVWQSNYEIGVNLLEECWNKNLSNLLASPLTKAEFLTANMICGFIKLILVLLVMMGTVYLCYDVSLFTFNLTFIISLLSLTISGWCIGNFASCLVLNFGLKAQAFTWTLAFFFSPLCAAYFPQSVLPAWAQPISYALPPAHVFENMRAVILTGKTIPGALETSFLLNGIYMIISLLLMNYLFERSRRRGFDHLE